MGPTIVAPEADKVLPFEAFAPLKAGHTGDVAVERRLHPASLRPMPIIRNVLARIAGRRGVPLPGADPSKLASLAAGVTDDLSTRLGRTCELGDFRATRTGSLTIWVRGDRDYVAKVPLQARTEPRLRQNAETLRELGQLGWVTPYLAARCPSFVLTGTASGGFYSVETAVAGQDGASLLRDGGSPEEMLLSAERFLLKLHKASARTAAGPPDWEAPLEAAAKRVEALARLAGAGRAYAALVCDITNRLSREPLPSVYSHGNFWLGNALFDGANTLTGVIDWDCSAASSVPAVDLIYLLVRTHSLSRSLSMGEALADWMSAESLPFLDGCLARHCRELSIPVDLVGALSYCTWIGHLDAHCRYGTVTSTNSRWLERNVRQVLERRQSAATGVGRWSAA